MKKQTATRIASGRVIGIVDVRGSEILVEHTTGSNEWCNVFHVFRDTIVHKAHMNITVEKRLSMQAWRRIRHMTKTYLHRP